MDRGDPIRDGRAVLEGLPTLGQVGHLWLVALFVPNLDQLDDLIELDIG